MGGAIAVAEACRNISCTGAEPVALTDGLNFGNPENSHVYYQLEECIKGIAEASRTFDAPIVSGNVSLYNESHGEAIYPTPIIGALGVIDDSEKLAGMAFRDNGDTVILLGAGTLRSNVESLGGSEYLELIHNLVVGRPTINLDLEAAVERMCRATIARGIAKSAHDCSDGGLAVALAECCITGYKGFVGDENLPGRWDTILFGETQSRIVISAAESSLESIQRLAQAEGVPITVLGTVGGDSIKIGPVDITVAEINNAWQQGIPVALGI